MKKPATSAKPRRPARKATSVPQAQVQPTGVLNPAQEQAVRHGRSPLLIIAGAGSGKTLTLAHRVVHLIEQGTPPGRILLLTFTRRAAESMLERVQAIRDQPASPETFEERVSGGTFHSTGARMLRAYGHAIGIDASFTIHDQTDATDLLDALRTELKLDQHQKDFPKKGTCQSVHSGWINSCKDLPDFLKASYPWCLNHINGLQKLFQTYADRKRAQNVFDFDDLLLYWNTLLGHPSAGPTMRRRFDCILVDEYQDTNPIQSQILKQLRPDGSGLTVVGDDAQSIYSFRGATVRNILDFPQQFPGTTVVKLEENYRSTEPILEVTNRIIEQATEGYEKRLRSTRADGAKPRLVACGDEYAEARHVVANVLEHQRAGIGLREQAVLFRASHHSLAIEMELARNGIAFHKYGGMKFAEAAHVKDLVAFLRLAENPRDSVSGVRLLKLLPGIGPKKAQALMDTFIGSGGDLSALAQAKVPAPAAPLWAEFVAQLKTLTGDAVPPVTTQIQHVLKFLTPLVRQAYDEAEQRLEDLRKLRDLAERYGDRSSFLAELTLDPPSSTKELAAGKGGPQDHLVLSTIHSAKGLEWDAVTVINAIDGAIPSSRALESPEQLDEELRLFYVALTRARTWLTVTYPRYRSGSSGGWSGTWNVPVLTRFLPAKTRRCFDESAVF